MYVCALLARGSRNECAHMWVWVCVMMRGLTRAKLCDISPLWVTQSSARPLKEGLESETDPLGVFGPLFISHTTIGDTRNSQDALWKQSVNSFTKCSWANVVIIFNYAFHNLAPYIYQGCLFHTQSWYYHLLPTNLFTCGIYKQVFLRIPQVFLRLCLHLFETCFWHQTTCPPV